MEKNYITSRFFELNDFFRIPRMLFLAPEFEGMSNDAKLLYTVLLDRASLSAANGWVDLQGRVYVYYSLFVIQRTLGCGRNKALKLLQELENVGLIVRKKQGQGKPSIIYVMSIDVGKTWDFDLPLN